MVAAQLCQFNDKCDAWSPDLTAEFWGSSCNHCIEVCSRDCLKKGWPSCNIGKCVPVYGSRAFKRPCCCAGPKSPPPPPPPPSHPPPPPSPPPPSHPPPSPPPPPPSSPPPPSPPPPSPSPPPPQSPSPPCPSPERVCKLEETYVDFHVVGTSNCRSCRSGCKKKCKSMDSTVARQMCSNEDESTTLFCTCCCKENAPATSATSRIDFM
ncbi:hypothetical protein MKW92_034904 [Papaver armeniacum]|nr:hypothetical protein MKW92_034904 [Papaver armeniacum]